jgi:hypothetical protein
MANSTDPNHLAARILAPTFDEATAERLGNPLSVGLIDAKKGQGSLPKLATEAGRLSSPSTPTTFLIAFLVAFVCVLRGGIVLLRSQRAPPYLLTA